MKMENKLLSLDTPLFEGIAQQDRRPMLDCITYHTATFSKGEIIAFEQENMKHIGIVLSGAVDMIKEDSGEIRRFWSACGKMSFSERPSPAGTTAVPR